MLEKVSKKKGTENYFFGIFLKPAPFLKPYMVWRNCSKSISGVGDIKRTSCLYFGLVCAYSKKTQENNREY